MIGRRAFLRFLGLGAAGAMAAPALPAAAPAGGLQLAFGVSQLPSLLDIELGEVTAGNFTLHESQINNGQLTGRLVMGDGSYIDLDAGDIVIAPPADPASPRARPDRGF